MNTEKQFILQNREMSFKTGIRYLKTVITTDYDKLPEEFKHDDVKNSWDLYEGIPSKLYQMTQSEDEETLELAVELLRKANIEFTYGKNHYGPNKIELWNN